jgi:hypothetical protein
VEGYYASDDATKAAGQYAQGVHVVVNTGRWEAFTETIPDRPPDGREDPWPARLIRLRVAGYWDADWGPKPGKQGYLGPPVEERAA